MDICCLPTAPAEQERHIENAVTPSPVKVRVAVIENPASGFNRRHPGQLARHCEEAGLPYRAGVTPEALRCCVHEMMAQHLRASGVTPAR